MRPCLVRCFWPPPASGRSGRRTGNVGVGRLCDPACGGRDTLHARGGDEVGGPRRTGCADHDAVLFRFVRALHIDRRCGTGQAGRYAGFAYRPCTGEYADDTFHREPEYAGFCGGQFPQQVRGGSHGRTGGFRGQDDILGPFRMCGRRQPENRRADAGAVPSSSYATRRGCRC